MDEKLKEFVEFNKENLPNHWVLGQKATEMAFWALEAGFGNLPELSINGRPGVGQKEYDQAVEEAYTWLRGECERFL